MIGARTPFALATWIGAALVMSFGSNPVLGADAPEAMRSFRTVAPEHGDMLLWESWLRHEVLPHTGKGERISVSFNYRW